MRRTDREITDREELLKILAAADAGRLALNGDDGYPYIIPLSFGEEDSDGQLTLYFHGTAEAGKKYELMARDDRAAFEVDVDHQVQRADEACKYSMNYSSVIMQGRMVIIPDEDKEKAFRIILRHYGAEAAPLNPEAVARTRCFALKVERMTGKRRAM